MKSEDHSLIIEIFCWVIIIITFVAILAHTDEPQTPVEQYVTWFHQDAPNRLPAALALVPLVEFTSDLYGVDPLLVAVIVSCESSWRTEAVGKAGERGLMQVHGIAAKGFPHTTEGRLEAGVNWLREGIRKCGNTDQALAWYNGDGCVDRVYAKRRWQLYQNAIRRFEMNHLSTRIQQYRELQWEKSPIVADMNFVCTNCDTKWRDREVRETNSGIWCAKCYMNVEPCVLCDEPRIIYDGKYLLLCRNHWQDDEFSHQGEFTRLSIDDNTHSRYTQTAHIIAGRQPETVASVRACYVTTSGHMVHCYPANVYTCQCGERTVNKFFPQYGNYDFGRCLGKGAGQ